MINDDKIRSNRSVSVNIRKLEDGAVRLMLDDIIKISDNDGNATWKSDCYITAKDYDAETFKNLAFTEKELADFGYYILSRLYAYYETNEI